MKRTLLSCLLVASTMFSLQAVTVINQIKSDEIFVTLSTFGYCSSNSHEIIYINRLPEILPSGCEWTTERWPKPVEVMMVTIDEKRYNFAGLTNGTVITFRLDDNGKVVADRSDDQLVDQWEWV